jgi:trehalose-phosphatase
LPDAVAIPALPLSPAVEARLRGSPLALLLDVDGTLAPIAPRPEYATVPNDTRQILTDLAATPNVRVVVISGRSADDARRLVDVAGVWIIGNHGIEVAAPGQAPSPRDAVVAYAEPIAEAASRATQVADALPGVLVENKRWTLSVHYRLAHPSLIPSLSARIAAIAKDLGLALTAGKEVLELRPPVEIDKGTAAILLADELGALSDNASIFCAGDDRTDEDMFRAVRSRQPAAVTVWVGPESAADRTAAQYRVPDTSAMCELLDAVLALRRTMG